MNGLLKISCIALNLLFGWGQADSNYISTILSSLSSNMPSGGVDLMSFVLAEDGLNDANLSILVSKIQTIKSSSVPHPLLQFKAIENWTRNSCINVLEKDKSLNILLPGDTNMSDLTALLNEQYEHNPDSIWVMPHTDQVLEKLMQGKTPIDSHIYLADTSQNRIDLSEIYQIGDDMPKTVQRLGNGNNILSNSEEDIWFRRKNLHGIKWRVGIKVAIPYSFKDNETNVVYGFAYELWTLIAHNLNVSSKYFEFDDYGKSDDGLKWNGVVGALQDGKVDVTLSPMTHSFARAQAVDFLSPIGHVRLALATFVTANDAENHISIFDPATYCVMLLVYVSAWLTSMTILWKKKSWKSDLGELAVLSLGTYASQGIDQIHLYALSQKILFYTQFLCSILVLAFFSANLTSTLAVREITPLVHNLEDVYKYGLNLYIPGGGNTESDFRMASHGPWHKIWEHQMSKDPKFYPHREEVFQSVFQDEKGVAFMPYDLIVHHMNLDKTACGLDVKTLGRDSFAMPIRKGFPYKNLINHQIEKIMESGVLDQIRKRHLSPLMKTRSYICSAANPENWTIITYRNVRDFFFLISLGAFAGLFVVAMEHAIKYFYTKKSA